MAKGFFISKTLGIVGIALGLAALATIIALSVVYSQLKQQTDNAAPGPSTATTTTTTTSTSGIPGPSTTTTSGIPGPSTTTTSGIPGPSTTPTPENPWNKWRLPSTLRPESYTISLQPFLKPNDQGLYVFHGNSSVRFLCQNATDLILIHSKKLNYTAPQVSLTGVNGAPTPNISSISEEKETEYLVVQLSSQLQANQQYELHTSFTGELADDLAGFYRSEYQEDGQAKVVATTQMQAADARKAFPCFDEPAMKATFALTLIHPPDHVALSNMPANRTENVTINNEVWTRTVFEPTLKMSTYLLAFIVSQFEAVKTYQNSTLIQIWGRPKAIREGQGEYALNVTGPILSFFERHYNTAYPLDKSDQVALPDFNAGAMENWGLVTYRENALLFDPLYSSIGNKERVVTVIAHELAHQWFGNLVTLAWWNDLWLNEGFASYVEYLGADAAEPTWNIKDLLVTNDMYRVMAVDALVSSHPLSFREAEIQTPAQISEVFDSIAYNKGASVLRMLSEFLTEERFKRGLQSYLHTFAYGNTVYSDLWEHLQMAVDEDQFYLPGTIENIMNRWTLQMGFPVLSVDTRLGSVSQRHFLLDPNSTVQRPSEFNYTWIVPVSWMTSDNQTGTYWLQETSDTNGNFSTASEPGKWLICNINVTGYFRVNYDQENWDRLLGQLGSNHQVIPVLNRAQLIDDAFNLARANYTSTELALNTTRYLSLETDYLPWDTALSNLGYFKLMFDRSEVYGPMKKYIRKQVAPLFEHFRNLTQNWITVPSGLMDQYNEISAISTACSFGIPECEALAADLFSKWRENASSNPITPNLRSSIYCTAIALGGEEAWDFGWEMFQKATVVSEADKLRSALACSQEPWILQRYLKYTLDPSKIRRQDATSTINSIARNVHGQSLVWDFVRANWKTLFSQYGGGSFSFASLIQAVTQRFSSEFELQQLEQFQKDNADVGFGSGTRAVEQALEKTKANIKWVAENQAAVLQWFQRESQ
ncbi:aminopeptidase N isoform X1 [Sphaerodactylus townsendi]|uniref:aminopeptidase N isoform X1 n=1 Tax=Sphaerodactylus townsendi TaxID=933632 RepID=UPI002027118D|nr:aminopeptidase N isoform X1 [Sphaerodactylus townsendi]XP_048337981.1 aminopeptidase N isoform X1 [Sphaerodactylus townsendi]XP_048337982.1 aminopeptidase N isoform X1 [Sphaerodactylus townsendi]